MARLARYFLPDQPLHLIQRGNNRSAIFFAPHDYALFRLWLGEAAAAHACAIHAYVLMTNHFHLVATPSRADSLPRMMQSLGRRYVQHVNRTQRRTGTLWEGRCRATPVDAEAYFFACCHYVEDNPVRARMVAAPADYVWSSYRRNTLEAADPLVVEHKPYTALGADAAARREAYRALFRPLDEAALTVIRAATNKGWALGGDNFRARVTAQTGRRAERLPAGRKRQVAPSDGPLDRVAPPRSWETRKMRV
jgi:putative transposase